MFLYYLHELLAESPASSRLWFRTISELRLFRFRFFESRFCVLALEGTRL